MSETDEERYEYIAERYGERAAFAHRVADAVADEVRADDLSFERHTTAAWVLNRVREEAKRRGVNDG